MQLALEDVEVAGQHAVEPARAVAADGIADERRRLVAIAPDDLSRAPGLDERPRGQSR